MLLARDIMEFAIEEALIAKENGEVPVGAIIVCGGEIVVRNHNRVIETNNALAHAEILAINEAMKNLNNKYLTECDLYVTLEPCSMCAGAIVLSKIRRLYIGTEDMKTGAAGSIYNIVQDKRLNHYCEIYNGIAAEKCKKILTDFFSDIRKSNYNIKNL